MRIYRKYAPSAFAGKTVKYSTAADRKALVGKRIGFDMAGSSMSHVGRVAAVTRYEVIFASGSSVGWSSITQIAILDDQNDGGEWKARENGND